MDIVQIISLEHQIFTAAFNKILPNCYDVISWQKFIIFCEEYLEKNHHDKEEKIIFSAVRMDSRIRMGGPLCTLYFDQYLQAPAIARAQKIIKEILSELKINTTFGSNLEASEWTKPIWTEDFNLDLSNNSPLLIPAGDHVAGRMLLQFAKMFLKYSEQMAVDQFNTFLKLIFFHYQEIQMDHFVREENCFLKMCQSLIVAEDWAQLSSQMMRQYPLITEDVLTKHFAKDR